jgi:hypothetical protein
LRVIVAIAVESTIAVVTVAFVGLIDISFTVIVTHGIRLLTGSGIIINISHIDDCTTGTTAIDFNVNII